MSPSRKHTVAVITACVAFVIFGFSFMFSSIALSIAPTTVLLCFRFTAAVLTLSLVVAANALVGRIRGKAWFSFSLRGKPLGGVLLLGLVQPVLYLVFENSSIRYASSAVTGTVLAVVPVICILADVFISHESVTKLQILCAVACVGGVALVETGRRNPHQPAGLCVPADDLGMRCGILCAQPPGPPGSSAPWRSPLSCSSWAW